MFMIFPTQIIVSVCFGTRRFWESLNDLDSLGPPQSIYLLCNR
jgi:hypothetical protein